MSRFARVALMFVGFVALVPVMAHAQASIAGVVRDASGAVLPGVTVEATSPVLIEKTRTVVTDGNGQYRIVDLRPGTYAVTFTLSGFSPIRREAIELTGSFVATIDVDLKVGSVQETITVTGESPIVDIQRTTQQRVFDQQVIEAIPAGRSHINMVVLIPGLAARPGINTAMLTWLRPAGMASMTCWSKTRCCVVFWVSTIGDSALTVTVSWMAPTRRSAFTVATNVPVSSIPSCLMTLKPGRV